MVDTDKNGHRAWQYNTNIFYNKYYFIWWELGIGQVNGSFIGGEVMGGKVKILNFDPKIIKIFYDIWRWRL